MLNFKTVNIVFMIILIALTGCYFFYPIPAIVFILPVIVYVGFLVYGSAHVRSNFYVKTISAANSSKKQIALSFDDGPVPGHTEKILAVLKTAGIQAAFFCIGKRVAEQEALFKQIYTEGHVIGNHSFSHHLWFDLFSSAKMEKDLRRMSDTMYKAVGVRPRMFRPPYGVTNPNLKKAIVKNNFITVGWSIRSLDTVIQDEQKLLKKVTASLKPGAIVLFHDHGKATAHILPALIRYCREEGFEMVRLDKLLNLEPYV